MKFSYGINIAELKPTQAVPLNTLMPGAHAKSLRLLQKMLRWSPSERISVESALQDLYVNHYHNPSDEPVCQTCLNFTFDEDKVDISQLAVYGFSALHVFCN